MSEQVTPAPSRPRLTRSADDRMIAGVCGGLADFTGIDPVIFRVVFVVAAIMGGAGLAAYLVAWLVIPGPGRETGHVAYVFDRDRDGRRGWWVVIPIVLALVVLFGWLDGWDGHWGGGGFGLLVLLAIGLWLFSRDGEPRPAPTAPPSDIVEPPAATDDTTIAAPVTPVAPAPRPRRERSKLGLLTFSAMILAIGVLKTVELVDDRDFAPHTVLAVCLLVVGAGLLVGSVYDRSRGLIALGILLTVLTGITSVADVPFFDGAGEREWAPLSVASVEREYRLGAGDGRLDLSTLDVGDETVRIEASVGMGELTVLVPPDTDLVIEAHAGFGEVDLFGDTDDGVDVTRRVEIDERGDGRLVLDARVGMGRVEVDR